MADFKDGKFQFQSVKSIYWYNVSMEGRGAVERAEKVWVPATLYMPDGITGKVPAMVIIHGIGGAYSKDGKKRVYWEYAEELAANGIAAVIVDTHGARGVGVASQMNSTEVSVYSFVADAFAVADLLRTNPRIDPDRIGIMGFSKGGMTALLAEDERFVRTLSKDGRAFKLHIPIYPGCQTFPEKLQPTGAPVMMLLGGKDNFTGIAACVEVGDKLRKAGVSVTATTYDGAFHSWDEYIQPMRWDDVSTEDCRWVLKDGGGVRAGTADGKLLSTGTDNTKYMTSCSKHVEIYVGRNERAYREGKRAVMETVKATLAAKTEAPLRTPR